MMNPKQLGQTARYVHMNVLRNVYSQLEDTPHLKPLRTTQKCSSTGFMELFWEGERESSGDAWGTKKMDKRKYKNVFH